MSDKNIVPSKPTVITVGKGPEKTVVYSGPSSIVTSKTGKVVGQGNTADLVFVFDTTGSMDDKIHGLIRVCDQFLEETDKLKLDLNMALVSFGDISYQGRGDRIETVVPLTNDIQVMKRGLTHIPRNNGFGNEGESSLEAIHHALELSYRDKAVKVLVLITDEPALQHKYSAESVTSLLGQRGFIVYCVTVDTPYFQAMAKKNGGVWKEIGATTDLQEILNAFRDIAKKIAKTVKDIYLLDGGSVEKHVHRLRLNDKN